MARPGRPGRVLPVPRECPRKIAPSTPGLAPCPFQIPRRVDVHQQEIRLPEPPQLLPDVLEPIYPLQKILHGPHFVVQSVPHPWQYRAEVCATERMASAPVAWDHRRNATSPETLQQVSHQPLRQERHVTGSDENVRVTCGGKSGLDARQGSLPAGSLVGHVPDSFELAGATPDDEHFVAGG